MRRETVEVLLPPDFQPPEAKREPTDAEQALINIGRGMSGLTDPVDALNFARAKIEIEERSQRRQLDEITAQVGWAKRQAEMEARAAEFGVSWEELKALIDEGLNKYRAVMKMRDQAHGVDIPRAKKLLADSRRRTAEQNEAALDRLGQAFDKSKPGRGDRHYGMNRLGEMVAAEMIAEKQAKAAAKKLHQAKRPAPKTRKPTWKERLAPGAKKAWTHFEQTGHGIVGDMVNLKTGREADVEEAARQLELWDEKREKEGLDYAGFPWPGGET